MIRLAPVHDSTVPVLTGRLVYLVFRRRLHVGRVASPTHLLACHGVPVFVLLFLEQLLRTIRFFLLKRKDAVAQWSRNLQSAHIQHEKEVRPASLWCPHCCFLPGMSLFVM